MNAALRPIPFAPVTPHPSPALLASARRAVGAIDRLGVLLPQPAVEAVHLLLRDTTTYYSNLIEGHDTHPVFLDAARQGAFAKLPALRDRQVEALAHAKTQARFEAMLAAGPSLNVSSPEVILGVHEAFYSQLPESMRTIRDLAGSRNLIVQPGRLRDFDVHVGTHVAPGFQTVPAALDAFAEVYDPAHLLRQSAGTPADDVRATALIAAAAAHHRLLWIHPFGDGNGRVARIITDLMLSRLGLGARGLWSMSRGLARDANLYKQHLANADRGPWNATDGRGPLSTQYLHDFCTFFVDVALDQVNYMSGVLAPDELRAQIDGYVRARATSMLPAPGTLIESSRSRGPGRPTLAFRSEAAPVLEWLLTVGSLPRGDVARIARTSDRTARRLIKDLLEEGFATSTSPRGDLLPRIPAHAAPYLLRRLFPPPPESPAETLLERVRS